MQALSVRQPWAFWLVEGLKDIENRTWPTKHRGNLLIHAIKGCTQKEYDDACAVAAAAGCFRWPNFERMQRGGIVGMVEVAGCVRGHGSPWAAQGQWHWVLRKPYPLPFEARMGERGLFEVNF